MYKHILLPVDGSELSEQALPHAESLARATGARLTLMSCVEPYVIAMPTTVVPVPAYDIVTDIEAFLEERQDYLDSLQELLAAKGVNADVVLREGRPADAILQLVEEQGVDLIVMSTHGRSGVSRFIYGSTAERVLHGAKVPVLLVRAQQGE